MTNTPVTNLQAAGFNPEKALALIATLGGGGGGGLVITSPSYAFPGNVISGQFLGISPSTLTTRAWVSNGTAVANEFISQIISSVTYVYQVTTAGTFTTTAPSHTTGSAANGSVTLTQINTVSASGTTASAYVSRIDVGAGVSANTGQGAFIRLFGASNVSSQGGGDVHVKTGGNFGFRNDTSRFITLNSTTGSVQLENIAGTTGDFDCRKLGGSLSIAQGAAAFKGDVTLVAGVGTVTGITNISANHCVLLGNYVTIGTLGTRYVIAITAATGFTVTARNAGGATETADTSTFKYVIIK